MHDPQTLATPTPALSLWRFRRQHTHTHGLRDACQARKSRDAGGAGTASTARAHAAPTALEVIHLHNAIDTFNYHDTNTTTHIAAMTDNFRDINVDIWEEDALLESDLVPAYHLDPASAAQEAERKSSEARGLLNR